MARGEKYVTLYDPESATAVEVTEERAAVLKDRGFTDKKPRDFGKKSAPARGGRSAAGAADNSAELAEKDAEIEALRKQLDEATAPPADQKK